MREPRLLKAESVRAYLLRRTPIIDALLDETCRRHDLPFIRVSIGIAEERLSRLRGPCVPDPAEGYDVACLNKLLIALVALQLSQEGALDLDCPVSCYLKEIDRRKCAGGIKLWHLMSNSTGLCGPSESHQGGDRFGEIRNSVLTHMCSAAQMFPPGTVFSYQAHDYVALAEIIERVSGIAVTRQVEERLLAPLGIQYIGRHQADGNVFNPLEQQEVPCLAEHAQGMEMKGINVAVLNDRDLVEVGQQVNAALRRDGAGLFGASLLFKRRVSVPIAFYRMDVPAIFCAYGLGCGEYRDGTKGHAGITEGQCSALRFDPARNVSVAIVVGRRAPHVRELIIRIILGLLGNSKESVHTLQDACFEAAEVLGRYSAGDSHQEVRVVRKNARVVCIVPVVPPENSAGKSKYAECVFLEDKGTLRLDASSRQWPVVFFRDPENDGPCLMIGVKAYKRVALI
jgi:CubicO group peptidase (beta-lactamase class C family)